MSQMDILDVTEKIKGNINGDNKQDLELLATEFKRNHFPNVLSKSKQFREKYATDGALVRTLFMVESASHAQIGEIKSAAKIIETLYQDSTVKTSDDLILLSELAFMSDFRLSRRIITQAVKQMEDEGETDHIQFARAYLVLGETEENLEKFIRAIKYYKRALVHFQENERQNDYMILFLHFKLGVMHSTIQKSDEAIHYLEKTILLANENHKEHEDIKINSMVSIAKTYGSKDENELAFPYLEKALAMLENAAKSGTMVHAEALTEMAFYYFDLSKLTEAVEYYDRALKIYHQLPTYSARKIGMIYMQYAYCLEHKEQAEHSRAGRIYEKAIEQLEKTNDRELIENALADVISFFNATNNTNKKRYYENRFVELTKAVNS